MDRSESYHHEEPLHRRKGGKGTQAKTSDKAPRKLPKAALRLPLQSSDGAYRMRPPEHGDRGQFPPPYLYTHKCPHAERHRPSRDGERCGLLGSRRETICGVRSCAGLPPLRPVFQPPAQVGRLRPCDRTGPKSVR